MEEKKEDKNKIDEKKNKNENKDTLSSIMSVFTSILWFGIILVIGTLTLYSVRASQTGLIPTNADCNPYTNIQGKLDAINVNINVVKNGENTYSTKVNFPIEENLLQMEKGFFGFLKKLIYGEKASTYSLYIGKTIENVVSTNFLYMNSVYNMLNSYFPESLIILIGPIMMFFIQITSVLVNMALLIYYWFYNIYLIFSTKKEESGKTTWKEHSIFDVFNLASSAFYYFIFFLLFCFCGVFVIPTTAFFISLYCIFFPLFLQSDIVRGDSKTKLKSFGLKQAIIDTFTFKKSMIMYLFSLIIINSVSQEFSSYVLVGIILGFLILHFFTDIYKQYLPKASDYSSSGLASFDPVKIETATVKEGHLSTIQTILKNVLPSSLF